MKKFFITIISVLSIFVSYAQQDTTEQLSMEMLTELEDTSYIRQTLGYFDLEAVFTYNFLHNDKMMSYAEVGPLASDVHLVEFWMDIDKYVKRSELQGEIFHNNGGKVIYLYDDDYTVHGYCYVHKDELPGVLSTLQKFTSYVYFK